MQGELTMGQNLIGVPTKLTNHPQPPHVSMQIT